jgi:hypothetical protein
VDEFALRQGRADCTTSRQKSRGTLWMSTFLPVRTTSSYVRSQPNLGQTLVAGAHLALAGFLMRRLDDTDALHQK